MKYSLLIIIIVHRFSSIQSTIWQFGSRTHWQCEEMTVPFGPPAYGILFTSLLSGGGGGTAALSLVHINSCLLLASSADIAERRC